MICLYLTVMMSVLFLPIFEPCLLEKDPKLIGAIQLQVTQRGLIFAKSLALEMLLPQLKEEAIQDQTGIYNVPKLGDVSFSFSNTQIEQLQVKSSEAHFEKGRGLKLAMEKTQIVFNSDWKIKHLSGQDNGTVQTNVGCFSLWVLLRLDVDKGGRPLVRSISCAADIGDLRLTFSGPNSQLYNQISEDLKWILIRNLNRQVCKKVKKSINRFSQQLRNMEFWAQIDSIAGIDYSLVSKPDIAEDRCNLDFKGEFFLMEQRRRSPLVPTPTLLPKQSRSMFVVGISDVLVNSAALVYFTGNIFRVKYTDKTIPTAVPFRLYTQHVGILLPELKKQFPEMPMELHLAAQKAPKLHFHPGGLDVAVLGLAEFFVALPNSSLVPVFSLSVDCSFTGQIFLEADPSGKFFAKVGGSVALKNLHLSQEWSRIGEIKVSPLETLLKVAGLVPLSNYNRKLRAGMLIPNFYGVSLMGPEVSMHEGYMLINTDLRVSLPNSLP